MENWEVQKGLRVLREVLNIDPTVDDDVKPYWGLQIYGTVSLSQL